MEQLGLLLLLLLVNGGVVGNRLRRLRNAHWPRNPLISLSHLLLLEVYRTVIRHALLSKEGIGSYLVVVLRLLPGVDARVQRVIVGPHHHQLIVPSHPSSHIVLGILLLGGSRTQQGLVLVVVVLGRTVLVGMHHPSPLLPLILDVVVDL